MLLWVLKNLIHLNVEFILLILLTNLLRLKFKSNIFFRKITFQPSPWHPHLRPWSKNSSNPKSMHKSKKLLLRWHTFLHIWSKNATFIFSYTTQSILILLLDFLSSIRWEINASERFEVYFVLSIFSCHLTAL